MKNIILISGAMFLMSTAVSAQIGVNTPTPKTTMDVSAKRDSGGNITDNSQLIGLQAPRLTRAELTLNTATYGINQKGALIYITDISSGTAAGQRVNIDAVGYYYFDGSVWQKSDTDTNIYKNDGTLTANRTLTQGGKTLTFMGANQQTEWYDYGFTQTGLTSSTYGEGSIGIIGADKNADGVSTRLWLQSFPDNYSQILADTGSSGLNIGTHATQASAPLTFQTSSGSGALGTEKMRITGEGNIGINTTSPTEKFDVSGNTRLRNLPLDGTANAIYTQSNGSVSATQNQTFTATRTVVADANGVLGYVNGSPGGLPVIEAGTDNIDAVTSPVTIQSVGGTAGSGLITQRTFTLNKKSMVTFAFSISADNLLSTGNNNLNDSYSKLLGINLIFNGALPSGFTTSNIINSTMSFANNGTNAYTKGVFYLTGTRMLVLNAGTYTVNLNARVLADDNSDGIKASFGTSAYDTFDIVAMPL